MVMQWSYFYKEAYGIPVEGDEHPQGHGHKVGSEVSQMALILVVNVEGEVALQ